MAQLEPTKAAAAREQLVYFVVEAEAAVVAAATTPTPPAVAAAGELYLQQAPAVAPVECPTPLVALVHMKLVPPQELEGAEALELVDLVVIQEA